jgi:hypothetical protein
VQYTKSPFLTDKLGILLAITSTSLRNSFSDKFIKRFLPLKIGNRHPSTEKGKMLTLTVVQMMKELQEVRAQPRK